MQKKAKTSSLNYKKIIEDFNILTQATPESEYLYEKPQFDDIENEYSKSILKDSKGQEYSLGCSIEEFRRYGSGIYLLFKFLKLIVAVFAVLSIFMLANVVIFSVGSGLEIVSSNSDTFIAKMSMTTLGNVDSKFREATAIIYFVCLIVFSAGIIAWKERQEAEVIECSKQRLLPSYYTVILEEIPNGYSENELKSFLEVRFGKVKEIFSAKQFHDDLMHYKEINEIIEEYKVERSLMERNRKERNSIRLIALFREFYYSYIRMKAHKRARYQPAFAFITFRDVESRQRLLAAYEQKRACCYKNHSDQKLQIENEELKFSPCRMEPDAINWQNITLSTKNIVLRVTFQLTLMAIVLIMSIALIFLLAFTEANLINPKYNGYSQAEIQKMNDPTATKYFCLSLSLSNFYSNSLCSPYKNLFIKIILLEVIIPLTISILKFLFTELMKYLVEVRRHANQIKKFESQIVATFIFYFIVSGLLQLVINLEVITSSSTAISIRSVFQSILGSMYGLFPVDEDIELPDDFTKAWFYSNSSKILLISVLSFNFTSIFNIVYSIARKKLCIFLAKKQEIYILTQQYLQAEKLQIEFIYAFALNIIFFMLLFSAAIPMVWIFGSFSLFVLFWVHKYIFIRYCQQPLMFSHSINHVVTRMILFGIVFSCAISPLLYGGVSNQTMSERYLSHLYFPILGAVILVYMFFKKVLLKLILQIAGYCRGQSTGRERLPSLISKINVTSNQLPSYSMHQNRIYSPVLKVLYTLNSNERSRTTFMLNQNLSEFFSQYESKQKCSSTFKQLLNQLKLDREKFDKLHPNRTTSNPYTQIEKSIKEILRNHTEHPSKVKQCIESVHPPEVKEMKQTEAYLQQMQIYQLHDQIVERTESEESNGKNSDDNLQSQRVLERKSSNQVKKSNQT